MDNLINSFSYIGKRILIGLVVATLFSIVIFPFINLKPIIATIAVPPKLESEILTQATVQQQIPILIFNQTGEDDPNFYPFRIFEAAPPEIDVPTLQQLAIGATTDQEIIDSVMAYYEGNKDKLAAAWRETNPKRVQAFLTMYIIHISHLYGKPNHSFITFVDYLQSSYSDCGLYAIYQARLLDGFNLTWRHVAISNGFHGWIEVDINGKWELFDATSNVWVNQSSFDLLNGQGRQYRLFYTPWTNINQPEARQILMNYKQTVENEPIGYTPGTLRSVMPGIGIYFIKKDPNSTNSRLKLMVLPKIEAR